jgi:3-hydroxy-3-methylglutaryl CoA synthase/uncharacterized OB-fold protein
MADHGILSWGGYIPRLRLERSAIANANSWANPSAKAREKGERSFLNWDEDSLTMAVEASRECLGGLENIDSVVFASTTPPFLERPSSVMLSEALNLSNDALCQDVGLGQRAATTSLISILRSPSGTQQLLVAADMKPAKPGSAQEFTYGAGASAVLVGEGDPIATLEGSASISEDFVSHYRSPNRQYEYHWEERWVRDAGVAKLVPKAINTALKDAGAVPRDITHFIFPTVFVGVEKKIAKAVGFESNAIADSHALRMGISGSAHALLILGDVLEKASPGDLIVIASFGHGCDALVLKVTGYVANFKPARPVSALLDAGKSETAYQKYLSFTGAILMDWGVRAEFEVKTALTAQYRYHRDASGFLAGKCAKCGTIQFPRAEICINKNCDHIGEQESVSLKKEPAKIVSFTADWLSFKECPPFYFGLVQFENGARALMEFADFSEDELQIGAPVEFVYRKKEIDHERSYHSYFWKAAPAR